MRTRYTQQQGEAQQPQAVPEEQPKKQPVLQKRNIMPEGHPEKQPVLRQGDGVPGGAGSRGIWSCAGVDLDVVVDALFD